MDLKSIRIKNYRSIKDTGNIPLTDSLFILAGQNESGKSSILEALHSFQKNVSDADSLNFEMENEENKIQSISCTYSNLTNDFYDSIFSEIVGLINNVKPEYKEIEPNQLINIDKILNIKKFTITKSFDFSSNKLVLDIDVDNFFIDMIKVSINKFTSEVKNGDVIVKEEKQYIDIASYRKNIIEKLLKYLPEIILFNDFTTLLPDKLLLSDLKNENSKGFQAVRNLEKLLSTDFQKIASKKTAQKNSTAETESQNISVNFQEDWQQKIYDTNGVNIKFFIERNTSGQPEISFYIETKESQFLEPRKRSKGMIWFLSLWLELKAKENGHKLIFLFDEPGLHLHIKAHKDMLSVFHKLLDKGHQIIYSTHSPSLIETDYLHNIGLVINTINKGTLVEGLTTCKINTKNKTDALQPIAAAMGLDVSKNFSILNHKNVIVEGLSDFWYFKAMMKLLSIESSYVFIPGIGIKSSKINHLVSFCIGYGLEWLLIMDKGILPQKAINELTLSIFNNDAEEAEKKIKILSDEIENLFSVDDLKLVDSSIKEKPNKNCVQLVGQRRKIVFSKLFYQKVSNNEITKNDINITTIKNFKKIFEWIEKRFN